MCFPPFPSVSLQDEDPESPAAAGYEELIGSLSLFTSFVLWHIAPPSGKHSLFPHPLNLAGPVTLLWLTECGKKWKQTSSITGLMRPCALCSRFWTPKQRHLANVKLAAGPWRSPGDQKTQTDEPQNLELNKWWVFWGMKFGVICYIAITNWYTGVWCTLLAGFPVNFFTPLPLFPALSNLLSNPCLKVCFGEDSNSDRGGPLPLCFQGTPSCSHDYSDHSEL